MLTPFLQMLLGMMLLASVTARAVAAEGTAPATARTVVFFGDSITAGFGLDNASEEAFPGIIQQKFKQEKMNCTVVNAGVSGDTSAGGLRRIDWLLRRPVDVFVLELGGNDGLRGLPPEETQRNLLAIIEKVRAKNPQAKVLIGGMQMPPNFGPDFVSRFEAVFPAVAKATSSVLLPFILDGVGGIARLNQRDRIHPTAEGHRMIAETVWPVLKPLCL